MALFDFLFGEKDKFKKLPTMAPEQQQAFQQLMQMLSGGGQGGAGGQALGHLQQLLDPSSEAYEKFQQPYMQQFEQQTVPMLAERFAGAGGGMGGALSSSGFGQSLSSAGANLQSQLAAMKTGMQGQAANSILNQLMGMFQVQPFAYGHQQASSGFIPQIMGQAAKGFGQAMGGGF